MFVVGDHVHGNPVPVEYVVLVAGRCVVVVFVTGDHVHGKPVPGACVVVAASGENVVVVVPAEYPVDDEFVAGEFVPEGIVPTENNQTKFTKKTLVWPKNFVKSFLSLSHTFFDTKSRFSVL